MLYVLLVANAFSWGLLAIVVCIELRRLDLEPETALARRAWFACLVVSSEARRLGPLFDHIPAETQRFLGVAQHLQARIRQRRQEQCYRLVPASAAALAREFFARRDPDIGRLRYVVEHIEEMALRLSRYRAGLGRLSDLEVPLACLVIGASERNWVRPGLR